jgi:predicted GIY-YIG superfamily endonuclease
MASFVGRSQNLLVSKLFAILLILLLLSCLSIFPVANASAQPCGATWDITGTSGIKSNYQLGEDINGSISFRINNPSDCPGCFLQILVGLVDSQNTVINVKCIYDGQPKVCPEWTVDTVNVSWEHPSSPGNYRLLATLDSMYSCSDAKPRFRPQESYKHIATITISSSARDQKSVTPTIPASPTSPPPAPPSQPDTGEKNGTVGVPDTTKPSGGIAPIALNKNTIIIISFVAALVILTLFASRKKGSKHFTKSILLLVLISFIGYLFWVYAIPLIADWFRHNLGTIITLVALAVIGVVVWQWIKKRTPPTPLPPNSEKENYSYIYIMRCQAYRKNLYKIGQSRDPEKRAIELSSHTGVAGRFEVLYDEYKLPKHDAVLAESRVHKALEKYRANDNREFFEVPIRIIIDTIRKIVSEMGYGD